MSKLLLSKSISTKIGPMVAMATNEALVLLEFHDRPILPYELKELQQRYGYSIESGSNAVLDQTQVELNAYFEGKLTKFETPLAMPAMPFQRHVWSALQDIPYGETRTYGRIAGDLGRPNASRAVGAANGQNRLAIIIPCHRVIGADGALTGYGGGKHRKRYLLDLEHRVVAGISGSPVFHPITAQSSMF